MTDTAPALDPITVEAEVQPNPMASKCSAGGSSRADAGSAASMWISVSGRISGTMAMRV